MLAPRYLLPTPTAPFLPVPHVALQLTGNVRVQHHLNNTELSERVTMLVRGTD